MLLNYSQNVQPCFSYQTDQIVADLVVAEPEVLLIDQLQFDQSNYQLQFILIRLLKSIQQISQYPCQKYTVTLIL